MFLILSALLLANWRGQIIGGLLLLSSVISAVWFAVLVFNPVTAGTLPLSAHMFEIFRNAAWMMFLYTVLSRQSTDFSRPALRGVLPLICGLPLMLLLLATYSVASGDGLISPLFGANLTYIGHITIALLGLLLIEKLYSSTNPGRRWALKFMCFGIGGLFIYDLFMYSDALLFKGIDIYLMDARGAVNALCVPLIALSVARNPDWQLDLFVSRHVIYHSTVAVAAGVYMMTMALAGYYVRSFGGEWGPALQTIFLFGAILILVILFFSTELRARLRVFLAKHFYRNKYDYREEWLGFARTLAENKDNSKIYETIIKAVAGVVKSPGGTLWLPDNEDCYVLSGNIGVHDAVNDDIPANKRFVRFMQDNTWIINLDEYRTDLSNFDDLEIPQWIISCNSIWLVVPLLNKGSLTGFIMLQRPHGNASFDWEDIDLLSTVSFQTAAYLDLLKTTEALSEARQFETFNRLSAFMVHDIKNIVAQLNFVTSNFPKYKENPEFLNDVMETITNASTKMNNLLGYLGKDQVIISSAPQKLDIAVLIQHVIGTRRISKPVPVLKNSDLNLFVRAEKDKLTSAIEHLIQNAQEAASEDGEVWISIDRQESLARIMIADDGHGMDEKFIKTRLFKPFDTTKGNAGMGIGVYESREIIRGLGGSIKVISDCGIGTVFTITIPCLQEETIPNNYAVAMNS
ncbi:putative PEP-CTERM system histidine kinase [Methylohalomonas lacus]|uniref:histidine kinase n=2 Tax=Methylohalomonas lacus TaxID=398773 RepID=A0AAE3HM42_9GAMM|nr:putative PEP-CTERM system histidine kinase [Methylohalomonas lacus]